MGELYVSYRKRFVLSLPGQRMFVPQKKDGSSVPLTDASLWKHVHGDYSVAVYAGRSTSRFMCFDVDVSDPAVVRSVIEGVEHLGIRHDDIHVSRSGLKGYHVELFFDR